jgi:predicted Fe-Mo cluster-binding NifX family protein
MCFSERGGRNGGNMIKIVVATTKGGLDDKVCATFGRAPTFTVVDIEGSEVVHSTVKPNEYAEAAGGAGIQAAQWVIQLNAQAVIAGRYGPNASDVFSRSQVKMVECGEIGVRDSVQQYLKGELHEAAPADPETSDAIVGMGAGGQGRGGGGGMGRGGGRGMGRGGGGGMGRGGGGQGMGQGRRQGGKS